MASGKKFPKGCLPSVIGNINSLIREAIECYNTYEMPDDLQAARDSVDLHWQKMRKAIELQTEEWREQHEEIINHLSIAYHLLSVKIDKLRREAELLADNQNDENASGLTVNVSSSGSTVKSLLSPDAPPFEPAAAHVTDVSTSSIETSNETAIVAPVATVTTVNVTATKPTASIVGKVNDGASTSSASDRAQPAQGEINLSSIILTEQLERRQVTNNVAAVAQKAAATVPIVNNASPVYHLSVIMNMDSILRALADLPRIPANATARHFAALRQQINIILQRMQEFGFKNTAYEPMLIAQVLTVFDSDLVMPIRFQLARHGATFGQFRHFLADNEELLNAGINVALPTQTSKRAFSPAEPVLSTSTGGTAPSTGPSPQSGAIRKAKAATPDKSTWFCYYCKTPNDHRTFECEQFKQLSLREKIAFMNRENVCGYCLDGHHKVFACRKKGICVRCKARHNSVMCPFHNQ